MSAVARQMVAQSWLSRMHLTSIATLFSARQASAQAVHAAAQSRQATVAMLQAYPNLKGIESPTTVGISSAAQYLSTSKKYKKKIVLTGLGLPSQMKKYVHDGTLKAFALWNPEDLGYLAGYAVSAFADGKIKGKVGETFKAGKLGTYKIVLGPDKRPQVILGPPYTFTIKNVDRFKF